MGMISRRRLIFSQYNKLYPTFVPNFKILGSVVPEKSLTKKKVYTQTCTHTNIVTEIFIGEKEKWINEENDKRRRLILSYTMQQDIPNICTKFQNPGCSYS